MTRYAALLRGVNVNGITIRSAELKALFEELGFAQVKTVLASGNVLFETGGAGAGGADAGGRGEGGAGDGGADAPAHATLKRTIEQALRDRFGYDAWIVLVDHADLAGIVDAYPFDEAEELQPYVVFASEEAVVSEIVARASDPDGTSHGERVAAGAGVVYWELPKGSSTDTALAKFLAKARFKATTTTRNLRTLRKLL